MTYLGKNAMRVLPISVIFKPPATSLPPIYTWPAPLKRIILALATGACLGAYLLVIGGLLLAFSGCSPPGINPLSI
jgi:hypothetical protein